jgi:hypothetical protein
LKVPKRENNELNPHLVSKILKTNKQEYNIYLARWGLITEESVKGME